MEINVIKYRVKTNYDYDSCTIEYATFDEAYKEYRTHRDVMNCGTTFAPNHLPSVDLYMVENGEVVAVWNDVRKEFSKHYEAIRI